MWIAPRIYAVLSGAHGIVSLLNLSGEKRASHGAADVVGCGAVTIRA
jgi:hypothetical protein